MLTSMQLVTPPDWPQLFFPLTDVGPDELLYIHDIDGLNPVDAAITTVEYGTQADGALVVGTTVGIRNLVIIFGLNVDQIDAAHAFLGEWFGTKKIMTLRFLFDNRDPVEIVAHVEKSIPDHFTQDPEAQISFVCPSPMFKAVDPATATGFSGISPALTAVEYAGNEINGFKLELVNDSIEHYVGDIIVEHQHTAFPGYSRVFEVEDVGIASGSTYTLVTEQGKKRVESNVLGSLLGDMTSNSFWLTLWPGENKIRVLTPASDIPRPWTITYTELYGEI